MALRGYVRLARYMRSRSTRHSARILPHLGVRVEARECPGPSRAGAATASPPRSSAALRTAPGVHGRQELEHRRRGALPAGGILDGGYQLRGELLAQFHPPLVERVDPPHHALGEYAVFVESDQPPERRRVEALEQNDRVGTAARIHLVRDQLLDPCGGELLGFKLGAHGLCRLPVHEGFRLRKAAGDGEVLLALVVAG